MIKHYEDLNTNNTDNQDGPESIANKRKLLEETTPAKHSLDKSITIEEIKHNISKLKAGKSCGPDNILNEFLTHGKDVLCAPISKLFNIIFKSNCTPNIWSEGHVTSIFKSGDPKNPDNYRGITILSCLGKLFTSLLKERLHTYLDVHNLLNKWQAGFRPGYRTSDQTFILKTIVNKYLTSNTKKLYVCFVDLKKAFDLVWHEGLFLKMLELGIGGNMYKIIKKHVYEIQFTN